MSMRLADNERNKQLIRHWIDLRERCLGWRLRAGTTARATHQGQFEGIPRNDRTVEFTELVVYPIAEDKIMESWDEIDLLPLG